MGSRKSVTALGVSFVTALSAVLLGLFSFIGNKAPQNVSDPIGKEFENQVVAQVFRQGWGFFTRDAREDIVDLVQRSNGEWEASAVARMAVKENLFGLKRNARSIDQDIGYLIGQIPPSEPWLECANLAQLSGCIEASGQAAVALVLNPIEASYCGEAAVTRRSPTPIAFARFGMDAPLQFIQVEIKC